MMRIAVFHDDCGDPGGANTYRLRLSSYLRESGHEVYLFTYRGETGGGDVNTTVFAPPGRRIIGGRIPHHRFPNLSVFHAFREWLEGTRPDILHIHTNYAFMSSVLLACRGTIPTVQTVHDFRSVCPTERGVTPSGRLCGGGISRSCVSDRCLSWKRYLLEIVTRRTHRFLFGEAVYRLIAPSRALQGALIKEGLPAVHIPHFADTTSTDHQPLKREESTILFVGFLHFSKGISLLLEAFDDVRKEIPSARLVVTGDGPMEEELRSRHRMLNLGDSVRFLGPISEEEVKKSYRRSTFVVLPSIIYENSPLVIYEAMASGRAVVGTRIGGIPELVIDGETGLLFERNDKSDLTAKMITLLKDKALADQMGRAGRRRAETEFTVEQHLDTVLHLYESAKRNFR